MEDDGGAGGVEADLAVEDTLLRAQAQHTATYLQRNVDSADCEDVEDKDDSLPHASSVGWWEESTRDRLPLLLLLLLLPLLPLLLL